MEILKYISPIVAFFAFAFSFLTWIRREGQNQGRLESDVGNLKKKLGNFSVEGLTEKMSGLEESTSRNSQNISKIGAIQSEIDSLKTTFSEIREDKDKIAIGNVSIVIDSYESPSKLTLNPRETKDLRFKWKKPRDIPPKAAFVGNIFGVFCAEIIITIGFIDDKEFSLFIYNPSNDQVDKIDLKVMILSMF